MGSSRTSSSKANKLIAKAKRRISTRPIDRFYRCFTLDSTNGIETDRCNGINNQQWRAADRLSNNYQRAFLSGGWNLQQPKVDCSFFKNTRADIQLQALHNHKKIFTRLNKSSQQIIEHVCLNELTLREYEAKQLPKLKKGDGMVYLKSALDELIEIYRTGSSDQKSNNCIK